jgi:hypothetical protein
MAELRAYDGFLGKPELSRERPDLVGERREQP